MFRLLLCAIVCAAAGACSRVDESAFFKGSYTDVDGSLPEERIDLEAVGKMGVPLRFIAVSDTLLFSPGAHEAGLMTVTDLTDGELVGVWCKKGRSWAEPLSLFPIQEFYEEDGDLKTDLISYADAKIFRWNITESLETGKTQYDTVFRVHPGGPGYWPVSSCYRIGDGRYIVGNTKQNPRKETMVEAPLYEIYDAAGRPERKIEPFNRVESEAEEPEFTPKEYFSLTDCIRPDRRKVAFAMAFFPRIGLLDVATGRVEGFRLKGEPRFDPEKKVWYFSSIQADDRKIYALYYGKEPKDNAAGPDRLYVFDWQGKLLRKIRLDRPFTTLWLDRKAEKLYFYHRMRDELYVCSTRSL